MCHSRPYLNKAFSTASAEANDTVTLTFGVFNSFGSPAVSGAGFQDTLQSGLTVAPDPDIQTTCNAGVSIAAQGSTISATGVTFNQGQASCSISVKVTSGLAQTYNNGLANVTTTGLEPPENVSVTFNIRPATGYPETTFGIKGAAQSASPILNDNPSTGATLSPSTVRLCSAAQVPNSCSATSVVVANEGTYAVNTTTGVVTFTPLSAFVGTSTGVRYQAQDTAGTYVSSSYVAVVVTAPTASPDISSGPYNTPQVLVPLANDSKDTASNFVVSSIRLCGTAQVPNNCTLTQSLTIANQGTYTLNLTTGAVTFTPLNTFKGTANTISYQVTDSFGQIANSTIRPTVVNPPNPTAVPDTEIVIPGATVTFSAILGISGLAQKASADAPNFASICLLEPNTQNCDVDGVVTIAGEGTYRLNSTSGVVTYTALSAATSGTKTLIGYKVTDLVGNVAASTLTPIVPPPPTLAPDTSVAAWDVTQTAAVLANDSATTSATLIASSVRLCAVGDVRPSCSATVLTIANQGTYTANANGTVSFDPLPSFSGSATAQYYSVTDSYGRQSSTTYSPTVTPPPLPTATADTEVVIPGATATFSAILGTLGLAQSANAQAPALVSVCLLTPSTQTCDADGVVTIANEGTYTLNSVSGVVTFVASSNVTPGTKTALSYRVVDSVGNTATSTLTPIVPAPPTLVNDTSSGPWDVVQTFTVVTNDSAAAGYSLAVSSLRLCVAGDVSPNCSATSSTVAGEGTYVVNSNGSISFDPLPTFRGTATPISYSLADSLGQRSTATYTPSVAAPNPPTASPDTRSVLTNTGSTNNSVSFTAIIGAQGLVEVGTAPIATICLLVAGVCDADNEVVQADGTYVLNTVSGVVTYTPGLNVVSSPGIQYRVIDTAGSSASSTLTPIIPGLPTTNPDSSYGEQGKTQVISPLSNDLPGSATAPLVPSSLKLCGPSEVAPNCTVTTFLSVPNVGQYVLNVATGLITFTPDVNYTGNPPTLNYQVADSLGQVTSGAINIAVLAPPAVSAVSDALTAAWTPTVTMSFAVLTNDSAGTVPASGTGGYSTSGTVEFNNASLNLCASNQSVPNCNLTTLTVAGEGTYTVMPDQTIEFDPVISFTGTVATSPIYQICNTVAGSWAPAAPPTTCAVAAVTPTITPLAPLTLLPDTTSGAVGQEQQANLVANDVVNAGLTSLRICSPSEVAPNCSQTQVSVPNVGTYKVVGGNMTFTPLPNFEGATSPIAYTVIDATNRIASSTYTPYVVPNLPPVSSPDTVTFVPGVAKNFASVVSVLSSKGTADLLPALTCILDGSSNCVKTLTTPDGAWTVDSSTGLVTFLPNANATPGTKTSVTYQVEDAAGKTARSTLTPIIAAPPAATNDSEAGPINVALQKNILTNDAAGVDQSLDPTSIRFCDTGESGANCSLTTKTVAGEGDFSVDSQGLVTFTPATNFFGVASTVSYKVTDRLGQVATASIAVTIVAPLPQAVNDSSVGLKNATQTLSILGNDAAGTGFNLASSTAYLCGAGQTGQQCNLRTLAVAGQGTYELALDGTVVFTPENNYVGTATQVRYVVNDSLGQQTTALISVVVSPTPVPLAVDDSSTGRVNATQTLNILSNDTSTNGYPIAPEQTRLCEDAPNASSCSALIVQIPNEGSYEINDSGVVTFTPFLDFIGTPSSVSYVVYNSYGTSTSAVIRITVTAVPVVVAPPTPAPVTPGPVTPRPVTPGPVSPEPTVSPTVSPIPTASPVPKPDKPLVAKPDAKKGKLNTEVVLEPHANDLQGQHQLVRDMISLCADACAATKSEELEWNAPITTADGTWKFDSQSAKVVFTPVLGFFGVATLNYAVMDTAGNLAWSTLRVEIEPEPELPELADTGSERNWIWLQLSGVVSLAAIGTRLLASAKRVPQRRLS
jgi:CshA-type fibril repeat protein